MSNNKRNLAKQVPDKILREQEINSYILKDRINNGVKISVVMPVYNTIKYIKLAIDSILNQSFKDWELIVINDGSTDGTIDYIKSINDSRIIIINFNENKGMAVARNVGLRSAIGKYVALFDSDDEMDKNRLQRQYDVMEANPSVDICGSWINEIDKDSKLVKMHKFTLASPGIQKLLSCAVCPLHDPSCMFKRELIEQSKYLYRNIPSTFKNCHPSIKRGNMSDLYLFLRWTLEDKKFYIIPEPLYKYRKTGESLLHTGREISFPYSMRYLTRYYSRVVFGSSRIIDNDMIFYFAASSPVSDIFAYSNMSEPMKMSVSVEKYYRMYVEKYGSNVDTEELLNVFTTILLSYVFVYIRSNISRSYPVYMYYHMVQDALNAIKRIYGNRIDSIKADSIMNNANRSIGNLLANDFSHMFSEGYSLVSPFK